MEKLYSKIPEVYEKLRKNKILYLLQNVYIDKLIFIVYIIHMKSVIRFNPQYAVRIGFSVDSDGVMKELDFPQTSTKKKPRKQKVAQ